MCRITLLIISLFAGNLFSKESGSNDQPRMYVDTVIDQLIKEYEATRKRDAKSGDSPVRGVHYEQTTYRSTEEILRIIRPKALGLHREYDIHFQGRERPRGSVTTRVLIAPDGRVLKAKIISDVIKDTAFSAKVASFFKGLEFEPINSKVIDSVAIPFTFPLNGK